MVRWHGEGGLSSSDVVCACGQPSIGTCRTENCSASARHLAAAHGHWLGCMRVEGLFSACHSFEKCFWLPMRSQFLKCAVMLFSMLMRYCLELN